ESSHWRKTNKDSVFLPVKYFWSKKPDKQGSANESIKEPLPLKFLDALSLEVGVYLGVRHDLTVARIDSRFFIDIEFNVPVRMHIASSPERYPSLDPLPWVSLLQSARNHGLPFLIKRTGAFHPIAVAITVS